MKIKYWVPENMMFEDAGTCLDTRPDDGAAALVVSHVAYDKAIAALREIAGPINDDQLPHRFTAQKVLKELGQHE